MRKPRESGSRNCQIFCRPIGPHRGRQRTKCLSLAFMFKVVIPLEVGLHTIRTEAYDSSHKKEILSRDLNLVDERRENALIQMADYQMQLTKTYNQMVQHRELLVGDLVLSKVVENTKDLADGKLGQNWERPYKIVKLASKGAYYLEDSEGKQVPRPWNSNNLKKYYH